MSIDGQPVAEPPLGGSDLIAHRRRGLIFLGLAGACVAFAMTLQMGLQSNFVGEELGIAPQRQGVLEAVRETCGISAFLLLAIVAGIAEPLVAAVAIAVLAIGLGSYAVVPDYLWLVIASLVWSQGLHVWMPLPHSMTLALAEPGRSGHRLGQIRAAGTVGSGIALGAAFVLTKYLDVPIRPLYILAGAVALIGAVAYLGMPRGIRTPGPRLVLRRRYSLYYLLCFLEGWRKQIFVAFAGYLLVRVYHTKVATMLLLWLCAHTISCVSAPLVGRLIDRIGERRILVFYFAGLTVFFVGYAVIPNLYVLYAIFVVDNAFFVFAMALTTYVNRLTPEGERTPTLSMGVAMNHIAAVVMPLVGGYLWSAVSYHWTFLIGAAAAAISIFVARRVPRRDPAPTSE